MSAQTLVLRMKLRSYMQVQVGKELNALKFIQRLVDHGVGRRIATRGKHGKGRVTEQERSCSPSSMRKKSQSHDTTWECVFSKF